MHFSHKTTITAGLFLTALLCPLVSDQSVSADPNPRQVKCLIQTITVPPATWKSMVIKANGDDNALTVLLLKSDQIKIVDSQSINTTDGVPVTYTMTSSIPYSTGTSGEKQNLLVGYTTSVQPSIVSDSTIKVITSIKDIEPVYQVAGSSLPPTTNTMFISGTHTQLYGQPLLVSDTPMAVNGSVQLYVLTPSIFSGVIRQ